LFYYFEDIILTYLGVYFFPYDPTPFYELWLKEYGLERIVLEGIPVVATTRPWASALNAALSLPQYAAGVDCPCRQRDGFGQPFPLCPD